MNLLALATPKPPSWINIAALGGFGLFLVAFLDSSVLSFPFVMDLLVISVTALRKDLMPWYAGMTTVGSLAGCLLLYYLAKKGGQAFFHRKTGKLGLYVGRWVKSHGFLSVLIGCMLPPPFPLTPVILAAGGFEVPLGTFIAAVTIGRGLRYFGDGLLAIRYGAAAAHLVMHHVKSFGISFVIFCAVAYGVYWFLTRHSAPTAEN
jgi:membrane protein YqaA with SNARE-associated domain